jgi:hypothetical protein
MDDFGIGGRMTDEQFAQFNFGEILLYAKANSKRNTVVENYLFYKWDIGNTQ